MKKLLAATLGFFIFGQGALANTSTVQTTILTETELRQTIKAGVDWLVASQEKNGHFRYEYMPFLDRYILDDNVVRQAGSLYLLGEIFRNDTAGEYRVEKAIKASIAYLEEQSAEGELGKYQFRCVQESEEKCTLGGTSLALLGVIDLVVAAPDLLPEYQDLISDYTNFLLAMKKKDEGFRNAYMLTGKQSTAESSFSNGEAFLALVRYDALSPSDEVKKVIDDSFDYFDKIYRKKWDGNFYLWGMAAIKDLYAVEPKDEYFSFVKAFTDWKVSNAKGNRGSTRNRCAYIEGVVSAYSVLEMGVSEKMNAKYLEEINFWLTKSRELQVGQSDVIQFTFKDKFKIVKIPKPTKAVGGFLTDVSEPLQRIDFTQHCVSSYLQKLVDVDGKELST